MGMAWIRARRVSPARRGYPPVAVRALKQRFPDLLGQCDILEFAGTDYAFRIFIDKQLWSHVLSGLAEATDYDNLRSEVARQGRGAAAYERALHDVWSVMYRLEK